MVRLLVVLPQSELGGLHSFWKARIGAIERRGVSATFVVPSEDVRRSLGRVGKSTVHVLEQPQIKSIRNFGANSAFLIGARNAAKRIADLAVAEEAEFVVGHGAQSLLSALTARIADRRYALFLHGNVAPQYAARVVSAICQPSLTAYELPGTQGRYPGLFRGGVNVLIPPVLPPSNPSGPVLTSAEIRRRLVVGESVRVLAFAGAFTPIKRPELFIRAVEMSGDRLTAFRVIGKVPRADTGWASTNVVRYVEKLHADGFDIRLVDGSDGIAPLLGAVDTLAITSRSEGVPNIALEALAAGTRILSVPLDGVELLRRTLGGDFSHAPIRLAQPHSLHEELSADTAWLLRDRTSLAESAHQAFSAERGVEPLVEALAHAR